MKYLLFFLFFNVTTAMSQQCRINYVNPPELKEELSGLRSQKKYDKILKILDEKRQSDSILEICYYHQVACYLSLKGDTLIPFLYIDSSLQLNSFPEDILSDVDFNNLKKTQQWKTLTDTLIRIYLKRYPDISNKSLSVKLWLRGIEDQKTRTLAANYRKDKIEYGSKEWKIRQKLFQKMTNDNAEFMVKWTKNHHWPYYSEVGIEAGDAAALFISHTNKKSVYDKALPAIKQAVDLKEADAYWYAVNYDRYCSDQGKKQIYGTFIYRHGVSGTAETGIVMSEWKLWPIEDEKNVDVRRTSLGLEPLQDYVKTWGINYEYNPETENQESASKNKKQKE